jgi:hypothetical protein
MVTMHSPEGLWHGQVRGRGAGIGRGTGKGGWVLYWWGRAGQGYW